MRYINLRLTYLLFRPTSSTGNSIPFPGAGVLAVPCTVDFPVNICTLSHDSQSSTDDVVPLASPRHKSVSDINRV